MRFLSAVGAVAACLPLGAVAAPPDYEPASHYQVRDIHGWKVQVNQVLLGEQQALGQEALDLLQVKLYDVTRVVPAAALARLREIPIWLEYQDKIASCACYHPSRVWLTEHGYLPDKEGGVEISSAATFVKRSLDQPWMVLHELAHGYHHRVLGHDHRGILDAYRHALDSGRYKSVLHFKGDRKKAYAMNNAKEYFAELSEAWFGTNDFYPFVRAEVRDFDPKAAEMLEEVWGGVDRPSPDPASQEAGDGLPRKAPNSR